MPPAGENNSPLASDANADDDYGQKSGPLRRLSIADFIRLLKYLKQKSQPA